MFYTYGITQQGTYHIKNDIVCQDAHCITKVNNDIIIATVADGLGSEMFSDIASKTASEVVNRTCTECLAEKEIDTTLVLSALETGFSNALDEITRIAEEDENALTEYDTTLSTAIIIGEKLYFGHVGDSGIIALTKDGRYEKVTTQQQDDYGCVYPLVFRENWVFQEYEHPVVSVLLATDGIYGTLFPYLLKEEANPIHVNLAQFFMDPDSLHIKEDGEEVTRDRIAEFLSSIPDEQVNDDKTLVVVINPEVERSFQTEEYYIEPNWEELKKKKDEEWKRKAYPHLFENKADENVEVYDEPEVTE